MGCFLAATLRFGFDHKSRLERAVGRLVAVVVIVKSVIDVCEAQLPVVTVNSRPSASSTMISSEKIS